MRTVLALCVLGAACAGGPQLHPDLHGRSDELIAAMRAHSRDHHALPERSVPTRLGWPEWPFGTVVAIDGPMLTIRMKDPTQIPAQVEDMVMMISNPRQSLPSGDGIVAGRMNDMLICRFFPNDYGNGSPVIRDSASLITTW